LVVLCDVASHPMATSAQVIRSEIKLNRLLGEDEILLALLFLAVFFGEWPETGYELCRHFKIFYHPGGLPPYLLHNDVDKARARVKKWP